MNTTCLSRQFGCGMMIVMLAISPNRFRRRTVMPKSETKILVCNSGSRSLKFSLFAAESEQLLAEGGVDWSSKPTGLVFHRTGQPENREELKLDEHAQA